MLRRKSDIFVCRADFQMLRIVQSRLLLAGHTLLSGHSLWTGFQVEYRAKTKLELGQGAGKKERSSFPFFFAPIARIARPARRNFFPSMPNLAACSQLKAVTSHSPEIFSIGIRCKQNLCEKSDYLTGYGNFRDIKMSDFVSSLPTLNNRQQKRIFYYTEL